MVMVIHGHGNPWSSMVIHGHVTASGQELEGFIFLTSCQVFSSKDLPAMTEIFWICADQGVR